MLYEEALAKEKSRHMLEEKTLRESLQEQEMQVIASRREITVLKDKMGRVHSNKLEEQEEILNDLRQKYDREKALLQEENRKLTSDLEKVRPIFLSHFVLLLLAGLLVGDVSLFIIIIFKSLSLNTYTHIKSSTSHSDV